MKNIVHILSFVALFFLGGKASAQIEAMSLMGIPTGTTTEMNNITGAATGSILYNTTDNAIYYWTGSAWSRATDDQTASEVNAATPVDVDGDSTTEADVEEVIQAIAPITSKAARVFYPPSIAIDASTNGTASMDLYAQYTAQFATPTAKSGDAPNVIPTYAATDLHYYVTYADPTVFDVNNMTISNAGVLSYEIIGQPSDYNSLINVVFVVK